MDRMSFGALAACAGALATILCGITVAMTLPLPVEIAVIVVALLLLACAGGLIGAAAAAHRRPQA